MVSESPKEFIGISTAVAALLLFIGMATGPAIAGVYMENHSTIAGIQGSYPTLKSYNLVFLTSALLSGISLGFAFVLNRTGANKAEGTIAIEIRFFQGLQDRPFWIWNINENKLEDIKTNGNCCFNHIIGLPQKDGNDKPLYDYEQIIFDFIVTYSGNKYIGISKPTGLGISEFMLRFMALALVLVWLSSMKFTLWDLKLSAGLFY